MVPTKKDRSGGRLPHSEPYPPSFRWSTTVLGIAANFHSSCQRKGVGEVHTWRKTYLNFIKLNVDAAVFTKDATGATTAILRDCRGEVLAAQCKYIYSLFSFGFFVSLFFSLCCFFVPLNKKFVVFCVSGFYTFLYPSIK